MQEHKDIDQPNGSADPSPMNETAGTRGEPKLDMGLKALCAVNAPVVFAICETGDPLDDTLDFGEPGSQEADGAEEADDADDGPRSPHILAWGLDFGERAVLTGCDGNYTARFSSPATAQRRLYAHYDTRLIRFRTA